MIQLGIFSLWTGTRDFKLTRGLAMLFSAAVAFGQKAIGDTELVTDIKGLEIADRLGWELTSLSLALEDFCPSHAKHVWMLGKIEAQRIQTRPFVHIDLDVLLLKPLPKRLTDAAVMVQSLDHPKSYFDPFNQSIARHCGIASHSVAYNMGMIGWNDLDFCQDYCRIAMRLGLSAAREFNHGGCISIITEQLLLGDMARQRRIRVTSAIPLPCHVFPEDMIDVEFVHLWGASKENDEWLAKVERRFAADHPAAYQRFLNGWRRLGSPCRCRHYGYGTSGHGEALSATM